MPEYRLPPIMERWRSTRRSTAGLSTRSSHQMNSPRPKNASVAINRMKPEPNQSSCWPSSSIVWKEANPMASNPMPVQSTVPVRSSFSVSSAGKNVVHISTARMPKGTLMKKIQRQPIWSVSQPPSTGPRAGPAMTPNPKIAWAGPRSAGAKDSKTTDCALASSPPPARPCNTRAAMRNPRLGASPHSTLDAVKPTSENTK